MPLKYVADYIVFLPSSLHQSAYFLTSATSRISYALNLLLDHVKQKPDIASIALLVLLLFISLQMLKLLYRTVIFWVTLAFRIVLYGGMAAIGLWFWTRGIDGVQEDFEGIVAYWNGQYEFYKKQQAATREGWGSGGGAQWPLGTGRSGGKGRAKWR